MVHKYSMTDAMGTLLSLVCLHLLLEWLYRMPSSCFSPGPTREILCLSLLGCFMWQVSTSSSEIALRTLPREPSRLLYRSFILFPDSLSEPCMGPSRAGIPLDLLVRHSVDPGCFHLPVLKDMESHDELLPDPSLGVHPETLRDYHPLCCVSLFYKCCLSCSRSPELMNPPHTHTHCEVYNRPLALGGPTHWK